MTPDNAKFLSPVVGKQLQTEWGSKCPSIYGASFDEKPQM
jgi:hypothetical protein